MGIFDLIGNGGIQNMDEEQARQLLDQIDDEQVHAGIKRLVDMYVAPHLYDIQEAVESEYPDAAEVRETYRNLSDDRQEEVFHGTMRDLLTLAVEIRERPKDGMMELKSYLRDPRTTEALLLIYENPNINPDYREQLKEYTGTQLFLLGTQLLPEMYSEDELRESFDILGIDPEVRKKMMNEYKQSTQGGNNTNN